MELIATLVISGGGKNIGLLVGLLVELIATLVTSGGVCG